MATAREVAEWMLAQLDESPLLYQETAVWQIKERFGDEFVYTNENGNRAISKGVLKEFRSLSEDTVVWERGSRLWRKRERWDTPGRRGTD